MVTVGRIRCNADDGQAAESTAHLASLKHCTNVCHNQ
jgi:hypothetical protein